MASDITRQFPKTVTDVATLILAGHRGDPIPYIVRNKSTTQTVYLGDAAVTEATGFPLEPGSNATIYAGMPLYGIVAAGQTADVRTLANRS